MPRTAQCAPNTQGQGIDAVELSIIVPTLNEAESLPVLLARMAVTLQAVSYEVNVVDDGSTDGTPEAVLALSRNYPVRLFSRNMPENGLSGAVLHGLTCASGKWLVVMDADLQHPPEKIPELLKPLREGTDDFVLGSRFMDG